MALEFLWRPPLQRNDGPREARRVALFPGAWNPPTIAHLEIARAALAGFGEVVWIIPRRFPHKSHAGASFEERCRMIRAIAASEPGFAAAIADGGLYLEMASEARAAYRDDAAIAVLCGRDAAERIERWDYGRAGVFEQMIREFDLVVAARAGEYAASIDHGGRISTLELEFSFDDVSSSEVRRRIAAGEEWEPLVPLVIRDEVRKVRAWT